MARRNPEELEPEFVAEGDINLLNEPEADGEEELEGSPVDVDPEDEPLVEDEVGETLIEVLEDLLDEVKGLRSDINKAISE